ncbi:MAG TPA: M3 family metallopeptidase [Candidatus Bathyarchaeia archaeon]|nr:M3 family metallopeptidase [Candidatus Bathyarchaeia archaeon]
MSGWNVAPVDQREQVEATYELSTEITDYADFSYDNITAEDVIFIAKDGLRRANEFYESVINSDELTWDAIMAPLDHASDQAALVYGRAFIMADVHPDPNVRAAAAQAQLEFIREQAGVWYRHDLYEKITAYSKTKEAKRLKGEKLRCLEATQYCLKRLGHELPEAERARLREIDEQLIANTAAFERNINNGEQTILLDAEELDGMSERFLDGLQRTDDGKYVVTTRYPHVEPIFMSAHYRETRRKVSDMFHSVGIEANRPLVEETLKLRLEYANLLGYPTWAHYTTDMHMAETPDAVIELYNELYDLLMERAQPEIETMSAWLELDGHEGPLMTYDKDYYIAKLQELKHGIDHEKISEYLPLDACLEAIHQLTGELYGIKYRKLDLPTWHEDVTAYEVDDAKTGEHIGTFYLDLFPREGKYTHAMTVPLQYGRRLPDGTYQKPIGAIIANYTSPTADKPSLWMFEELITHAHEHGHLLHLLLSRAELMDFTGFNVEHDFSEAPSQMTENWMKEPQILQRMARHYRTGEPLDAGTIKDVIESRQLYDIFEFFRRMHLGDIDLALHDGSGEWDVPQINRNSSTISQFLQEEKTFLPAKFGGHIMGGYEGGYHAYAWSKVKADDHYSVFERKGITNPEVGMKYRKIFLERGGTKAASDNEREFLGRKPNNKAFLRRLGISAAKAVRYAE